MTTFEQLDAWQAARGVVNTVYSITRHSPLDRDFGLCSQLQRAAVSIMTNIAEGFERRHIAEKLQFYNVARASNGELRSLLYVVEDNYTSLAELSIAAREELVPLGRLVSGLMRSTQQRQNT
ncbi:MAG: four helix bundle protein [Patescibacteria group bacterium]|nr:four helix bundle protein [Patescibacteria group bacterium]